jgi:hypothetical protein
MTRRSVTLDCGCRIDFEIFPDEPSRSSDVGFRPCGHAGRGHDVRFLRDVVWELQVVAPEMVHMAEALGEAAIKRARRQFAGEPGLCQVCGGVLRPYSDGIESDEHHRYLRELDGIKGRVRSRVEEFERDGQYPAVRPMVVRVLREILEPPEPDDEPEVHDDTPSEAELDEMRRAERDERLRREHEDRGGPDPEDGP